MAEDFEGRRAVRLLSAEEFRAEKDAFRHGGELLRSLGSVRYCKAELYPDCVLGTLRIPRKKLEGGPQLCLGFYLADGRLTLVEAAGRARDALRPAEEAGGGEAALLGLLSGLTAEDVLYLSGLDAELLAMEDELGGGRLPRDFFLRLARRRRKLAELDAYYEQLAVLGGLLASRFPAGRWDSFTRSAERLLGDVRLLREEAVQLRELAQAQQSAAQNRVMVTLTVVTTVFLPLSLLTGWYGMNFANMPELRSPYGYPAVIAASVLLVALELIYFKRKKYF